MKDLHRKYRMPPLFNTGITGYWPKLRNNDTSYNQFSCVTYIYSCMYFLLHHYSLLSFDIHYSSYLRTSTEMFQTTASLQNRKKGKSPFAEDVKIRFQRIACFKYDKSILKRPLRKKKTLGYWKFNVKVQIRLYYATNSNFRSVSGIKLGMMEKLSSSSDKSNTSIMYENQKWFNHSECFLFEKC